MSDYFLAQNQSVTIQAPQTISAAATGVITVGSTTDWNSGDIVLVSGVGGATGVNGKCSVTVSSGTTFTLKSLSTGATLTFGGSYTSGGTVTHIGHLFTALTLDNTVFTSANPDFTLKSLVLALTAATAVRIAVEDTGDAFASDIKPGPCVLANGLQAYGYETPSFKRADAPGLRLGNANNALRAAVYLEGVDGAVPSTGQSVTFSTWVEA